MNQRQATAWALLSAALMFGQAASAQTASSQACERTRAEVRNECIDFLSKYRWDEASGDYVSKSTGKAAAGVIPPEGVKTRQQIRADRDAYLRAYRWNDATDSWEPLNKAPRDVAKLSREQVRKETAAFMKTHQWDELSGTYVDKSRK